MQAEQQGMNMTVDRMEWFTQQQLEALSQDSKNRVYTYSYDDTVSQKTLPADEMKNRLGQIRQFYLNTKIQHPEESDDKLRYRIRSEKYAWKEFAQIQPQIFVRATTRETDESIMKHLFYMLYMFKKVESGLLTMEQAQAQVREHFLQIATKPTMNPTRKRH